MDMGDNLWGMLVAPPGLCIGSLQILGLNKTTGFAQASVMPYTNPVVCSEILSLVYTTAFKQHL